MAATDPLEDEVMAAARRERDRLDDVAAEIARIRAEEDDEANWQRKSRAGQLLSPPPPRPAPGARGIGMVALIEPGMIVWSRTRGRAGVDDLTGEQAEPLGGVVVEVLDQVVDDDGVLVRERSFSCIDPNLPIDRAMRTLAESEVDADTIESNSSTTVKMIRRLAGEVAARKRKSGILTTTDAEMVRTMHRLAAAVMGGRW